jgi:hypothetical protein
LFFFEGAGSNVCKPGDEINEREQKDEKLMGLEREKRVGVAWYGGCALLDQLLM